MSQGSDRGLGILNTTRFFIARLRERLWLKPLLSCLSSLAAVFVASLADSFEWPSFLPLPDISAESIQILLEIIAASMLVIAVFAAGAMINAYASASNTATPRSFPLVVSDDVSQNALSTFIGAFIFSIVALAAILNGFYGQAGRFFLFGTLILVFALVILSFVRWVDTIARLGRMGNTIEKVEKATEAALQVHAAYPALGAIQAEPSQQGTPIYPKSVGFIQNVDLQKLQCLAENLECHFSLCALPGCFVTPGQALAYIDIELDDDTAHSRADIRDAFVIANQRTFQLDPCFGLVVLSEVASRALSPAVNDPGTAIDAIGTLVRLFTGWSKASREREKEDVKFDRLSLQPVSLAQMFDNAFNAISRDGASYIEVASCLQDAFHSLSLLGDDMRQIAQAHARLSLAYAREALLLKEEVDSLESLVEENFNTESGSDNFTAKPGRARLGKYA